MAQRGKKSQHLAAASRSRRWWRWLNRLGFAAPLLGALVAALVVAGSFRLVQLVRNTDSNAAGDVTQATEAGGTTAAVALDGTEIDVDRPVDPDLGRAGTAADELRRRGRIGEDDTLAPTGREGQLGSRVFTRTRQEHRGVPIFAGEVVVTTEGERIIRIHGHPAPDVDLETTSPANDYPATVALAEAVLEQAIVAEDDGTLVIMPAAGGYRLAWVGNVVIDEGSEQVALDAETGAVLHRVPRILQGASLHGRRSAEGYR